MAASKSKTLAEQGEASAALAEASSKLAESLGTTLVLGEPKTLEETAEFVAQDGSRVEDHERFLAILRDWRGVAEVLGNLYREEEKAGPMAAAAIAGLRRTIIIPGGAAGPDKPDYFGDSYLWKTYVSTMLKRELEGAFGIDLANRVWNRAVNYYHGANLTIDAAIVDDAIADGRIKPDDAKVYQELLAQHGNNLGKVRKDAIDKVPESVCEVVNSAIDGSSQKRDAWKLEKKERKGRDERIGEDPAKAVNDAVYALKVAAVVANPGDGPKLAPLASWEAYYRGQSELLRSMMVGADGKPRKGGLRDKPKVRAEVESIRDMLTAWLSFDADGKPEFDTVLSLLYSDNAAAQQ